MKTKLKTSSTRPTKSTIRLKGLGVAPGIAIGPIYLVARGLVRVPEYLVQAGQIDAELARFADACSKSVDQLGQLKLDIEGQDSPAVDELVELLGTHIHMLQGSRLVRGVEARIRQRRLNAEAAVQAVLAEIAETMNHNGQ